MDVLVDKQLRCVAQFISVTERGSDALCEQVLHILHNRTIIMSLIQTCSPPKRTDVTTCEPLFSFSRITYSITFSSNKVRNDYHGAFEFIIKYIFKTHTPSLTVNTCAD